MRELALFAGAGGGLLASRLLGWRTVCAVEIDPYCRSRLLDRQRDGCLPKFPVWNDVQTFDGRPWCGSVDVVSGGFPCQDVSAAGQGIGIAGKRSGLVFEMLRIVDEVRPSFVFAENSPQLRTKGLATIVERFIRMGYVGRVGVLGAGDIGANHERKRMWIVAIAKGIGCRQGRTGGPATGPQGQQQLAFQTPNVPNPEGEQMGAGGQSRGYGCVEAAERDTSDTDDLRGLQQEGGICSFGQWPSNSFEQSAHADHKTIREQHGWRGGSERQDSPIFEITDWWCVPRFAGVDDGLANRMDRVKATGNGQVAGVAALVWSLLTSDLRSPPPVRQKRFNPVNRQSG